MSDLNDQNGLFPVGLPMAGQEFAAALLASTVTAANTAVPIDVPGLSIAPVIGARGVYVDFVVTFGTIAMVQVTYTLIDVTAGAPVTTNGQPDTLVVQAGAVAGQPINVFKRWKLTPGAGARAYKIQSSISSNGVVQTYGSDFQHTTGLFAVGR